MTLSTSLTCSLSNAIKQEIFFDLDGSLTGFVNGSTTPYYAFNNDAACVRGNATFENGTVCDGSKRIRRLQVDSATPRDLDFTLMNLKSSGGNATVAFRPKEIYGWTMPVVIGRKYNMSMVSAVDWQTLRLRYSEVPYVDNTEWLQLAMPYYDTRVDYAVTNSATGAAIGAVDIGTELSPAEPFGTSRTLTPSKTWEVILTTRTTDMSSFNYSFPGPLAINARPLQCAEGQCTLPGNNPLGLPQPWEVGSTWTGGVVPAAGADVTIEAGKYVDLSTSRTVGALVVFGKLRFLDVGDITFVANSILVWGELEVGRANAPFTHLATIILKGIRSSPTVIVSNDLYLGNKVLVNLGKVNMYGNVPAVAWTKLASTANTGDNSLTLTQIVDWKIGSEIVVTSTEYDANQVETFVITGLSADGLTISLDHPVVNRHFAGTVSGNFLAAAVGLLTRNVVITSDLADASDTYGAHVITTNVVFNTATLKGSKFGSGHFQGVEFRRCGKGGMQYGAVQYSFTTALPTGVTLDNTVVSSSFSYSFNYGMVLQRASDVILNKNVVHRTFKTAVDVDALSTRVKIDNNLVAGNYRFPGETLDWIRPFAGFYIDTASVLSLSGNVVGGTADSAFVFRPDLCTSTTFSPVILNNEAHSALVGAFILSYGTSCVQLTRFRAWKIAHVAVLTVDQTSNMQLSNIYTSDSHIGVSLNFFNRGGVGNTASITNSVIFGATPASTCADSLTCRALSKNDAAGTGANGCTSVFGNGYRNVGIVIPQYLNRGKTCERDSLPVCRPGITPERLCSMPWELRYGLPTNGIRATFTVSSTTFGFFGNASASLCGKKSIAMTVNPSQPEFTPEVVLSGLTFSNSPATGAATSRGWFSRLDVTTPGCSELCDALQHLLVRDTDGSTFGAVGTLISDVNPALSEPTSTCSTISAVGGIFCTAASLPLRAAMFQNLDLDRGSRLLGPVRITKSLNQNRTTLSRGPLDDNCAKRFFFGQYPFTLEANRQYDFVTQGSMPANTRVQFFSTDPNERVLLRIFFTDPLQIDVFVGGTLVPRQAVLPTLTTTTYGANVLNPQERVLYLLMRGGNDAQQTYDLRVTNVVQLSMSLAISLSQFYSDSLQANIATLLSIDASRIKIAAVSSSRRLLTPSVAVTIIGNPTAGITTTAAASSTASSAASSIDPDILTQLLIDLSNIVLTLKTTAVTGDLKTTLDGTGVDTAQPVIIAPPVGVGALANAAFSVVLQSPGDATGAGDSSSGGAAAVSVGIVAAFAVGVVAVAVVVVRMRHSSKNRVGALKTSVNNIEMDMLGQSQWDSQSQWDQRSLGAESGSYLDLDHSVAWEGDDANIDATNNDGTNNNNNNNEETTAVAAAAASIDEGGYREFIDDNLEFAAGDMDDNDNDNDNDNGCRYYNNDVDNLDGDDGDDSHDATANAKASITDFNVGSRAARGTQNMLRSFASASSTPAGAYAW